MRFRDLGELTGPVLVFGGPYSNLQATRALIDEATHRGIPAENCICTGDTLAYCAEPVATVAMIRAFGCPVIAGNVERQLATGVGHFGHGFEAGGKGDASSAGWLAHVDAETGPGDRTWMARLPDWILFTHEGRSHAVVHGGASDIARNMWQVTPRADFEREWDLIEGRVGPVDVVIAGHSGLPFIQHFSFGTWINAGAIGLPPNDGSATTVFAILDGEGPSLHRLSYDQAAAAQEMVRAGLTDGYHTALLTGYWPSEDSLPPSLRVPSRASG